MTAAYPPNFTADWGIQGSHKLEESQVPVRNQKVQALQIARTGRFA